MSRDSIVDVARQAQPVNPRLMTKRRQRDSPRCLLILTCRTQARWRDAINGSTIDCTSLTLLHGSPARRAWSLTISSFSAR